MNEAKRESEQIGRNLDKAPDTVKLADFVWELRFSGQPKPGVAEALERVAIQVSGWAQDGHNVGLAETRAVLEAVKAIFNA